MLIQRSYSRKSDTPATFPPAVSYLLGVMPIGFIAGFLIFPHHIIWSWWLVFLLLIEGVAMALANWLSFVAVRHLPVAAFQTISRLYVLVVIGLGWLLLKERLTSYQSIGASLLLAAGLLAIFAPRRKASLNKSLHGSAVVLTIISSISLGVALLTEKVLLRHMDIGGVYIVGWSTQTLALIVLAGKDLTKRNFARFKLRDLRWSVMLGLTGGLTGIFYVYAIYHADNISLVTAVSTVALPLSVFGAYALLHERDNQKLLIAALGIACIGLIMTSI